MITTRELIMWLDATVEYQEHYARRAERDDMAITNYAAAANYAAKAELLRTLVKTSERDDKRRAAGDE